MRTIRLLLWLLMVAPLTVVLRGQVTSTLVDRIPAPSGATRVPLVNDPFAAYLRHLPLKPAGTAVHLFDGRLKARQDVHVAVIDLSVGQRDLQQCADAVIRLRAEHLFATGQHSAIRFHFTNGFLASWERWRAGERIRVTGNEARWVSGGARDSSHDALLAYLTTVFTYAGTRSLQAELRPAGDVPLRAGDVFIQGGSPGHAVIVLDVARTVDGRSYFLLAQSYMPAQDIHVLKGPVAGAWFEQRSDGELRTPEWSFAWSDRRIW